jgi:NAD(P)-dependent dehydrogenase (short-subunit alcohol dehydrogenase family)
MEVLELEVTSQEPIARCAEEGRKRTLVGITLDMLVNNARHDFAMPLLDFKLDDVRQPFEVNFWNILAVPQAFAPPTPYPKYIYVCTYVASVNGRITGR